jgi:hypothetical protein
MYKNAIFASVASALVAGVCLMLSGCGPKAASSVVENNHEQIMKAVRSYRPSRPASAEAGEKPAAARLHVSTGGPADYEAYMAQIRGYFLQQNFDALETEAREARTSKARFSGGTWKINNFYAGVVAQGENGQPPTEADWDSAVTTLKAWAAAKPNSAAARIALANAYIALGWRARGSGYADSVTREGWKVFHQQVVLAANALLDAAKSEERCPYWYVAMQKVALAQQWDRPDVLALFDESAAFEPEFYYYYQDYANYLEPKWSGVDGETEAFAEESRLHVGGDQGDIIYFEIASNRTCWCEPDNHQLERMSWPQIKRGYEAIERLYGSSNYKNNRFAFVAYQFHQQVAAGSAFQAIENARDPSVWGQGDLFEKVKAWANGVVPEQSASASRSGY